MPVGESAIVPLELLDLVYARQLQISGSRGMGAQGFQSLLSMIECGQLNVDQLVTRQINLGQVPDALLDLENNTSVGVTVVTDFHH
jgi:alcohol dehydrogenase